MKLLVQTTGHFALRDTSNGQVIHSSRPTVVDLTPFVDERIGTKLDLLDVLADDASDQMLRVAPDLKAAIDALPRPKPEPEPEEKPAPKSKK
jgi:hypothetical protein